MNDKMNASMGDKTEIEYERVKISYRRSSLLFDLYDDQAAAMKATTG